MKNFESMTGMDVLRAGEELRRQGYQQAVSDIAAWMRTTELDTIHRDAMDAAANLIERGEYKP